MNRTIAPKRAISSNLWLHPWRSSDKSLDLGIRRLAEDGDVKVDDDEARAIVRTRDNKVIRIQIELGHPMCVYEGDCFRELMYEIKGDRGAVRSRQTRGDVMGRTMRVPLYMSKQKESSMGMMWLAYSMRLKPLECVIRPRLCGII